MMRIPDSLLLGSATAATQIEGGDRNTNWYAWSLAGGVTGGESSLPGADHYRLFREDVDLMASLGHQCYRMSVEWSRVEPQPGQWSSEAIAHYREEISLIRSHGIVPLVTLHHFSCPQWFQDRGGWVSIDCVDTFLRFCRTVVEELGDLVSEWCTINEPNVFANDTYMDGRYPPGHCGDVGSYLRASRNMVLAHLGAYRIIHETRAQRGYSGQTRVGFAHHLAVFQLARTTPLALLSRWLINRLFHEIFFAGFVEGRLIPPLGIGRPAGTGPFCDYVGINYYSRHLITPTCNPTAMFGRIGVAPDVPDERLTDLGWEIFPSGLGDVVAATWQRYHLPIFITENGVADATDSKRARFIHDHLEHLLRAIDNGARVERYFHWSLLDNLEWNDGYAPRFGLVEVDYETMKRHVRPSARYYRDLCRTRTLLEVEDD